jgi:hypothetical protein
VKPTLQVTVTADKWYPKEADVRVKLTMRADSMVLVTLGAPDMTDTALTVIPSWQVRDWLK